MNNLPKPHSSLVRNFYFWLGVVATVLYRAIIVMNHVDGPWAKVFWYVGTAGFILYFAHRFQISELRAKIVRDEKLMDKITASNIAPDDRRTFEYVLGTLQSSKERWNYIIIFVTSALALIAGVWLDFLK